MSLRAYDEYSAQMLENMADRLEGKTYAAKPLLADSGTAGAGPGILSHGESRLCSQSTAQHSSLCFVRLTN